ncbi:MAG: hypothetical protein JSR76_05005 [Verrucomicrobia bacterium]|nr:hypothetical protein [Verrucomicrobiota bacterium]
MISGVPISVIWHNQSPDSEPASGYPEDVTALTVTGETLPSWLPKAVNLHTLRISFSRPFPLPDRLLCSKLVNIEFTVIESLPDTIGASTNLLSLRIQTVLSGSLPESLLDCRKLSTLSVGGLSTVPPWLARFPALKRLALTRMRSEAPFLPDIFAGKTLSHLDISRNKLTALPPSLMTLPVSCHLIATGNCFPKATQNSLERFPNRVTDEALAKVVYALDGVFYAEADGDVFSSSDDEKPTTLPGPKPDRPMHRSQSRVDRLDTLCDDAPVTPASVPAVPIGGGGSPGVGEDELPRATAPIPIQAPSRDCPLQEVSPNTLVGRPGMADWIAAHRQRRAVTTPSEGVSSRVASSATAENPEPPLPIVAHSGKRVTFG